MTLAFQHQMSHYLQQLPFILEHVDNPIILQKGKRQHVYSVKGSILPMHVILSQKLKSICPSSRRITCVSIAWHIIRFPNARAVPNSGEENVLVSIIPVCAQVPPPPPPARGTQNNSENEPANDDTKIVLTSFTPSRDTPQSSISCLLKMAIAPITYKGTSIESNILFDEDPRDHLFQEI